MEEGALSPGMSAVSRSWKRQGIESPLEPPEGSQPCWHLDFSPAKTHLGRWRPDLYCNKFVLFQATMFVAICFGSIRKLIHNLISPPGPLRNLGLVEKPYLQRSIPPSVPDSPPTSRHPPILLFLPPKFLFVSTALALLQVITPFFSPSPHPWPHPVWHPYYTTQVL